MGRSEEIGLQYQDGGNDIQPSWLNNFRNQAVYKYGRQEQVPRNHAEAVMINEKNGNTDWQEAEDLEISQLMAYKSFESEGYKKKISCHFVYNLKHTGKCKARLVVGGHRMDTPTDSIYSGVVPLCTGSVDCRVSGRAQWIGALGG
jgi:hypothetical protein